MILNDILSASVFCLFYNVFFLKIVTSEFIRRLIFKDATSKKFYLFSLLYGTIFICGCGYNRFSNKVNLLDKKYYPVKRLLKLKETAIYGNEKQN